MRQAREADCERSAVAVLRVVGEWWSVLILRDCLHGLTRFDQFQKSLAISPNLLSRRLQSLTEAGLVERRRYCAHPPRFEYVLTERGRDFHCVIAAMVDWGTRNFPVTPVDHAPGRGTRR